MNNTEIDNYKVINVLLYVTKIDRKLDFHKVFKILYFAEQKHLVKYAGSILQEEYVAMKNGPVPSLVYDLFKTLGKRGSCLCNISDFQHYFKIEDNHFVTALKEPDLEYLSDTEIECLDESIRENGSLTFNKLTEKSHDSAWKNADPGSNRISIIDIAIAGKASEEMIEYIKLLEENKLAFSDQCL